MKKRIITFIMCLALVFTMGGGLWLTAFGVSASAEQKNINNTTVEEDLINVDLSNYPRNPTGDCEIISVMEYAYSEKEEYKDDYNLYIYVYNPTCKDISLASGVNFVNVGVQYWIDIDGNIRVDAYENIELEFVSKQSDNRFYKFKLKDSRKMYSVAFRTQFNHKLRAYDIIGLQIRHSGEELARDYTVDTRYVWTGYGENCGSDDNEVSTLEVKNYSVRSIHLELYDTYYRFGTQSDGVTQDTLNSVYIEVPVEYFHEFGNLHKIKAQWYEYVTKPVFVTSELAAYQYLFNYISQPSSNISDIETSYSVLYDCFSFEHDVCRKLHFKYGYNIDGYNFLVTPEGCKTFTTGNLLNIEEHYIHPNFEEIEFIHWLFYRTGPDAEDYIITTEAIKEYMRSFKNRFPEYSLLLDKYPAILFEDSIDEDRLGFLYDSDSTSGLVVQEFVAGEDFLEGQGNQFIDADSTQSAWNKYWFGTKYEEVSYSPIVTISEVDLYLTPEQFSEKYYVHKDDAENFLEMAKEAYKNDKVPVLFRFAVTDYYHVNAYFDAYENEFMSDIDGYVAQETVFLDFDIISLGFKSEEGENEVVIGVVANPIDIINDITPPENMPVEDQEWWQKIMLVLALIVVAVVVVVLSVWCKPVLDIIWQGILTVLQVILWIITRPFVWIANLFKRRK